MVKEDGSPEAIVAQIDKGIRLAAEIEKIELETRAAGLKIFKSPEKVTFHAHDKPPR
ncbi:MAG: hypothetical protein ACE5GK_10100 [Nitrospiria bacterium]